MNMTVAQESAKQGTNYTVFESGALKRWIDNSAEIPGLGKVPGKLFLKDLLGLTSCEISINAMPPGDGMPFHHTHKENEEVYIFVHGKGQVQIDGQTLDVHEGSIVRIAPNGERTWRNNGSEMLVYIVMQMRDRSLQQYGVDDADVPQRAVVWPS
jgi:quercetin dioxygenase-like cupin family protein